MSIRQWLARNRTAALISGALFVVVGVLVALSLGREPPVTFAPSALEPVEVGDRLVGPTRVTVDASDPDAWVFFDFSRGATVADPDPTGWDLAFRRFNVAVNGGAGFAGQGGVVALDAATLDSVAAVPATGYAGSDAGSDSTNPAIERWYDYGFTSHLLTPKPQVYAVRTADGRYAIVRFVSYYCPGAQPGCMTFEYVYRGDGSRWVKRGAARR